MINRLISLFSKNSRQAVDLLNNDTDNVLISEMSLLLLPKNEWLDGNEKMPGNSMFKKIKDSPLSFTCEMKQGASFKTHFNDKDKIIMVFKGSVKINYFKKSNKKTIELKQGDSFKINKCVRHNIESDVNSKFYASLS